MEPENKDSEVTIFECLSLEFARRVREVINFREQHAEEPRSPARDAEAYKMIRSAAAMLFED